MPPCLPSSRAHGKNSKNICTSMSLEAGAPDVPPAFSALFALHTRILWVASVVIVLMKTIMVPSLAFAADKVQSIFTGTRVHFVTVKSRPADLRLLGSWLEDGLEVPVASTIPVRDVAKGLAHLQKAGGRISVRVADGF